MLQIEKLQILVGNEEVLKWVSMKLQEGKKYLLLWKNWSGKSSLANFIMWNPKYICKNWKIILEKNWKKINILDMTPDERSKAWFFLSFQNVPEIEWIRVWEYLRVIYNLHLKNKWKIDRDISPFIFNKQIKKYLEMLSINESFLDRDLNVGFSWWEKRKIEILQMLLIEPSYIILDEIDSWLDIDALKIIINTINSWENKNTTFIIITHKLDIADYIDFDEVFVIKNWKLEDNWDKKIIEKIKEKGYE